MIHSALLDLNFVRSATQMVLHFVNVYAGTLTILTFSFIYHSFIVLNALLLLNENKLG